MRYEHWFYLLFVASRHCFYCVLNFLKFHLIDAIWYFNGRSKKEILDVKERSSNKHNELCFVFFFSRFCLSHYALHAASRISYKFVQRSHFCSEQNNKTIFLVLSSTTNALKANCMHNFVFPNSMISLRMDPFSCAHALYAFTIRQGVCILTKVRPFSYRVAYYFNEKEHRNSILLLNK